MRKALKRKLHISWILFWASLGVLAGIGLSSQRPVNISLALVIFALSLLAIGAINLRGAAAILVLTAGLILGLARGSSVQADLLAYQKYIGSEVVISGQVSEDVSTGPQGDQRLRLKNISIQPFQGRTLENGQNLSGEVWVSAGDQSSIKRSDVVIVRGQLSKGFGSFPAAIYRADIKEVIRQDHADVARDVRDWFASKIRLSIGEPEASLGIGYLVGQRSTLPEDLVENLRILGLTHIVVASGYNLTILVRFTRKGLAKISKYLATISALVLTLGFVMITGFSPSMTRAGIITTLSLLAWYFGRNINPVVLLGFVAALTAMINPSYLWGDLGWYLSFTAFGGVIILSPLLIDYFWGDKKPNAIRQVVVETTSAQLLTLPILALAFGQIALLATFANTLILPLIPFTMVLTFIAGVGAAIIPSLAGAVGWPADFVLSYMTTVVDRLSGVPITTEEVNFTALVAAAIYALIIAWIFWLKHSTKHDFRADNLVE